MEEIFDNFPLATAHNMYFQHDSAPAHNAGVAAALLNEQYPECWIETNGLARLQQCTPDFYPH